MARTTGQRPSTLVGIEDPWTAYQLDSAVVLVGSAIRGAAQEMREIDHGGGRKELVPRYTMAQLLDPEFRLPIGDGPPQGDGLAALKALGKKRGSGVRVHKVS